MIRRRSITDIRVDLKGTVDSIYKDEKPVYITVNGRDTVMMIPLSLAAKVEQYLERNIQDRSL